MAFRVDGLQGGLCALRFCLANTGIRVQDLTLQVANLDGIAIGDAEGADTGTG